MIGRGFVQSAISQWLSGRTFKAALLNGTYVEDVTDLVFSDVSAKQVSGTGYTAGGVPVTLSLTVADDLVELHLGGSVSFGNLNLGEVGAFVVYDTGSGSIVAIDIYADPDLTTGFDYTYSEGSDGLVVIGVLS